MQLPDLGLTAGPKRDQQFIARDPRMLYLRFQQVAAEQQEYGIGLDRGAYPVRSHRNPSNGELQVDQQRERGDRCTQPMGTKKGLRKSLCRSDYYSGTDGAES